MSWFYGALGALGIAVVALSWQLKVAWQDVTVAKGEAIAAVQAAGEQRQQAELILSRLESLDGVLGQLADQTEANDRKLDDALTGIENITKTEGDSDESIACLGVPVPAQLDSRLR